MNNQLYGSVKGDPHCLSSCGEFAEKLQVEMSLAAENQVLGLMVVNLQRSDRIAALLSDKQARQLQESLWSRFKPILRSRDSMVFVSPNELWVMLPDLSVPALALLAAHRLLAILEAPIPVDGGNVYFSPCIGVVCTPIQDANALTMLRIADNAQKKALNEHQKFSFASGNVQTNLLPENLPKLVAEVIEANGLNVVYQPKVDLSTMRIHSVEALVRCPSDHPEYIPVNVLIETVERCGLVEALTLQVINIVLRESSQWQAAGLDVLIWINLSARLLAQAHLTATLAHKMNIWLTHPSRIGLELTESALIQDVAQTTEVLCELKRLGFHLSIDDFGTGYSSFAYLRRFPIDELKIDKLFVQGMIESLQDRQIVKSIIDLAHNFGLPVVAEGVEDEKTLNLLKDMGCEQIQGFYFAKPMPAEQLLIWCAEFHRIHTA
ncbi:EAL domain-containing protein [Undibacterium jejuense]|uniref:EAL domain-containing protein n=1 Tax=Undibacterium jejuense TaxID=1344949 RepID=A0A923HFX1_9BURK|nr:EAL domain-containing protein [Undibacterium jejuense]MBC3863296.1 EAL domain-containing protein [Undibacterium jejuense]